jgi:biotin carboxyl carrier protein
MGLDGLTEEILPALIARLRASRLAELEVRSDGWRVRLRRDLRPTRRSARGHSADGHGADAADDQAPGVARSPAVGYFTPEPRLVVGRSVAAGDLIGSVDVLGIPQEVTAPLAGIVSMVLAESGQAVEYGQPLAEIDSLDAELPADLDAGSAAAPGVAG